MISLALLRAAAPAALALSCAAGAVPANVDSAAGVSPACDKESAPGARDSLPRYFTLELNPQSLADHQVLVDGASVPEAELRERLGVEAKSDDLRGAALLVAPGVKNKDVLRLFRQLRVAGFSHVLVSGAQLPSSEASVEPETVEEPRSESVAGPEVETEPVADLEPPPPDVVVKNLGLHVGGGPNSAANKKRYSTPIAKRFEDFRRCHLFADGRERNASFGVDLLVGARGGRAKIKDYRTSLKGKDFHLCVLGIFGEIEFPVPPRPTVVSYSLLFKKP